MKLNSENTLVPVLNPISGLIKPFASSSPKNPSIQIKSNNRDLQKKIDIRNKCYRFMTGEITYIPVAVIIYEYVWSDHLLSISIQMEKDLGQVELQCLYNTVLLRSCFRFSPKLHHKA